MIRESTSIGTVSNKKLSLGSLLVILLVAGCTPSGESTKLRKDTGPAIQNETQTERTKSSAEYTVTISEDNWRTAFVSCHIVTGDISSLVMNNNGAPRVPNGYASFVRNLTAVDSSGNTVSIKDLGQARWEITPPVNEPITLYYEVLLEHDKSDLTRGPAEAPYVTQDGVFWTGRALFIVAETNDITVHFNLPDGWHASTPWLSVPGQPSTFFLKNAGKLTEAFVFAGTHIEQQVKAGNMDILIALGNRFKQSKGFLQSTVQKHLDACVELFGGTPTARILTVMNHLDRKNSFNIGVLGWSISVLMGNAPNEENEEQWAPLIIDEALHLLYRQAIKHTGRENWFSEGFASYYSMIMCPRLGLKSEEDFIQRLTYVSKRYFTKLGPSSIRETQNYELQYTGGSLVALCMDIQIRKATNNEKSLDDLTRRMYQEFGRTGRKYSMDDVISIANSITKTDHTGFFKSYVAGTDELPLEQFLGYIGLDMKKQVIEELPARYYAVHVLLRMVWLGQTETGLTITMSEEAGYKDGDNLIAVAGTPVKTFRDIQMAVKTLKAGDKTTVTVLRDGKETNLDITLGGQDRQPVYERQVKVGIEKKADLNSSQKALLSGIIGR